MFNWGDLRRVRPVSRHFGFDRGQPIDRYYIEQFLSRWSGDIRGRVLEIGDDSYTRQVGGDRVVSRDVWHVERGNPMATIIGDLTNADHIPSNSFDCFILTQTLHLLYDPRAGLRTVRRILKPGGVVLATFPGISQTSDDQWAANWHWSFTQLAAERMFGELFDAPNVTIETFGNVLAAMAFLQGLAAEELSREELDYRDEDYDLLLAVRAVKSESSE